MHIHHVIPIEVKHLFPVLDKKLMELLQSLSEEEWHHPTIAKLWTVKDIAAHMLDGNMRHISLTRDKHFGEKPGNLRGYADLVNYLNSLNAVWVQAFKRVSPQLLIEMLQVTGEEYYRLVHELEPWAEAVFPVAWAGEEISANWFHIAREYSEKWIHQQQIRAATGREGLFEKELFHPFIATVMCGLPYTYKDVMSAVGTSVAVRVPELDDEWHINKTEEGWVLRKQTRLEPNARLTIDSDSAWKLFSKGITAEEAKELVQIEGDEALGRVALNMVSVMA